MTTDKSTTGTGAALPARCAPAAASAPHPAAGAAVERAARAAGAAFYELRRPCPNCPFRKVGAVRLAPGRLAAIIADLVRNDYATFYCHKTVDEGNRSDDDAYVPSGQERMCAGAMAFLEKAGCATVGMRMALRSGTYCPEALEAHFDAIIDPAI